MDSKIMDMVKSKKSKPDFKQQNTNKLKRIRNQNHWRKPRGQTSSIRLNRRGYLRLVRKGFGSPRLIKNRLPSGYLPVMIFGLAGLDKKLSSLNPTDHILVLSSSLGLKSRLAIIEIALKKGFKVNTIENPKDYLKSTKETLAERKNKHDKVVKKKKEASKNKEAKQKSKKDESKAAETSEEEKVEEKKDLDKILTKPQ